MSFDFDRIIDRRNTGSEKWERYAGRDVLPMWVADMDFASPPCVLEALHRRVDHGVFGYTLPVRSTVAAIVAHLAEHYRWTVDPAWIVFTPGVNRGMNLVCRAIGERGEAVVRSARATKSNSQRSPARRVSGTSMRRRCELVTALKNGG